MEADHEAVHTADDEIGREIYDDGESAAALSEVSDRSLSVGEEVTRPSIFRIFRTLAINMFLPFVNGMMLGFGEIIAHEFAFRLGWGGTRVFPLGRRRHIAPGVEMTDYSLGNETRRERRERDTLEELTSLE